MMLAEKCNLIFAILPSAHAPHKHIWVMVLGVANLKMTMAISTSFYFTIKRPHVASTSPTTCAYGKCTQYCSSCKLYKYPIC